MGEIEGLKEVDGRERDMVCGQMGCPHGERHRQALCMESVNEER